MACSGEPRESLVYCEVAQITDAADRAHIREEVARRLQDVLRATGDFHAMLETADRVVAELAERAGALPERRAELTEVQDFLRWLRDGAFVFLGYRGYDLVEGRSGREVVVEGGSGLGILRNEAVSLYARGVPLAEMDPSLRAAFEGGPILIVSKTRAESTVHRRARMDYIGVKKLDPAGGLVGEHRFIGLFTSRAYAEDAERIPILRDKLQQLLQASGVTPDSHDYKEIHTIFNSMPKEDLFLTSAEQIGADIRAALTAYNTDEVRVTLREDVLHRGVSAMVIIPHERYSGKVRRDVEGVLATALGGETLNFYLALGGGDQARLHFYLVAEPGRMRTVRDSDLERSIRELMRSWTDRVGEGLERVRPPDDARRHARRYAEAFSAEYQAITSPDMAVQDILELEAMHADGRELSVSFSNSADLSWVPGDEPLTELKVYLKRERLVLSEFMPTLENAGLRVIAVNPFEVRGGGVPPALIYVFAVQDAASRPLDVEARGSALGQTILAVRAGDVSDDILNGLVLSSDLHWREVDVLRAFGAVRTNYYQSGGRAPSRRSGGVPYTSFKFACDALSAVTRSRLLFEVWVRSSRMEGVHLRGARVARGGIRWSDRLDDFRTEILGLVKTQMVKNAVIVPAGSKGGWVRPTEAPP